RWRAKRTGWGFPMPRPAFEITLSVAARTPPRRDAPTLPSRGRESPVLDPFDDRRGAHARADAQRDESGVEIAALQFVEHGAENDRAGRAERMAHRNRTAIDVDLVVRNIERLHVAQHDRSEGFVELEQVDVRDLHVGFFKQLLGHVDRAGQHDGRFRTDIGEGADAGAWLEAHRLAGALGAEQYGGSAVNDARRIAGMVNVVDRLDFRVTLDGDGVEAAHFARHDEGRVERGQRLHVGARA